MSQEVLVLNADYEPLNVCNLRRAIVLVYLGKADILHERTNDEGKPAVVSAEGEQFNTPSVVKLRHHVKRPLPELKLSRRSVFARDNYTCQYCGVTGKDLTIDHVIPKRMGGGMTWENLVTCCRRCNTKKGDKLMDKVGMRLARPPRRPRYTPYISLNKYVAGTRHNVWRDYLPIFTDIAGAGSAAVSDELPN
jgi:5-methylcytosine-specific restriction endonuclease McrA